MSCPDRPAARSMIPLPDAVRAREFPIVNVAIIIATSRADNHSKCMTTAHSSTRQAARHD
jgi:hypothetical protein